MFFGARCNDSREQKGVPVPYGLFKTVGCSV